VLSVTEPAVYCATFNESRSLPQELQAKAQLRFALGSYPLPAAPNDALGLPACVRFGQGLVPVSAGGGSLTYSSSSFDGSTSHNYLFEQPVGEGTRGRLQLSFGASAPDASAPELAIDGSEVDPSGEGLYYSFAWCEAATGDCFPDRLFDSCTHESSTLNRHEVVIDGEQIALELRIGSSFAGTEPGAFVRASGTFEGVVFDQQNYFKLVYRPEHHHFRRDFAVLFDEPIAGACGVEVFGLDPFDLEQGEAHSVDCELNRLETLTLESHTLLQDP
jgi:hypothetical protein